MSYDSALADISRSLCILDEIDLDFCSLTYGDGACTASGASGTECYNTYKTCQDKANFGKSSKTHKLSSMNVAPPFIGARPYLEKTTHLATEIKDKLSVKARIKSTYVDEPDTDVGIDPYVANRASVQGTYWQKMIARNPNFKGRPFRRKVGFLNVDPDIVSGPELIDDGDFTGDGSAWTLGTGWTYNADNNRITDSTTDVATASQSISVTDGDTYLASFDVTDHYDDYFPAIVIDGDVVVQSPAQYNGRLYGLWAADSTGSVAFAMQGYNATFSVTKASVRKISAQELSFMERFAGTIDNITLSKGKVTIEAVDLLSSLSDVTIAAEIEAELNADITATSVSLTLTDTDELTESTGYIKLSDEIIYYTAKNDTTNTLTTELQYRGMFDTTAAVHSEGDSVQPVYYFAPDHPHDHMDTLLTLAEIDSRMNTTAFADYRDFPGTAVDFSAIIHEPTKASDLFWELVNFTNSVVWQDEAQQISIRKLLANEPGRSYGSINDTEHIVGGSSSADLNDKSRVTRVILYWDRTTLGDEDEVSSYQTIEIAIDADAESANEYNDEIEERLFCRWLRHGYEQDELVDEYAELLTKRRLMAKRDAQEIVTFKVELKDEGLKTGDSTKLTTDTLSEIDGTDLTAAAFMVIKRDPGKGKSNELEYKVKRMPKKKICFICPDDFGDGEHVAAQQAVTGAGNLTLTASPVTLTNTRKCEVVSRGANSSVTFTVTGKDENGDAQVSAATNMADSDGATAVDSGSNELYWTEISQIAMSGACFGDVSAGVFLEWADASGSEREYGFIAETDGDMDATNRGYHIY